MKYKDLLHSYRSLNISGECGNTNLTIFISCVCMQQSFLTSSIKTVASTVMYQSFSTKVPYLVPNLSEGAMHG